MKNLYDSHYPLMKKKAYTILKDQEVIEDVIQEAFIRLIPKTPLLRTLNGCKVTTYVVNTIKHYCYDHIRRRTRRSRKVYTGLNNDVAEQIPDLTAATEENYIQAEAVGALTEALLQLSERDRNLLYFKYKLELGDQQIGELVNIPPQHVRQYIARARGRVLRVLSEAGMGYQIR
ncbi:RNA polymerase sigma factor [Paenibacillus piscarius]|uniref:RNA polymerase sigma factor n=1 Tax=Paenibacillus piscarius TaxID=1089681 RepID=UPI0023785570|nr:sigma-70 family RNA polymerase sigma factor [Paenibacillus piscarius]